MTENTNTTTFSTETDGLETCRPPAVVDLKDGDSFELHITPVVKQLGDTRVRMLSYNGSVPGPTLRLRQGSEITVHVRNDADVATTVHWHGLRLANEFDGVPYETQAPIEIGGEFTYRVSVPDPGVYWYHPHIREDYGLDMGLYGNIVVVPDDEDYWAPANREVAVTLDDLLVEDGCIAPFSHDGPTHVAMGRFGNTMLTGGEADLRLVAHAGEVVRFFLTNTANTRLFNVAMPGSRMKLVGGDSGRYERESFIEEMTLAFESLMPLLYNDANDDVTVSAWTCPMHPEVVTAAPGTCPHCGMKLVPASADAVAASEQAADGHSHAHTHDAPDGLEWEDLMPEINARTNSENMIWKLVDRDTGKANAEIDWTFAVGDQVKIRLVNGMDQDHPMHHPFHVHGAGRFLVLSRGGVVDANLVWKDTVLVRSGETVDILLDVSNPGLWMAHCHIAEHNQSGMMFSFAVTEGAGA